MKRKHFLIIYLIHTVLFSVSTIAKETPPPFNNNFTEEVLTGEEERIKFVVDSWITLLIKSKEQSLFPSNVKTKADRDKFLRLLENVRTTPVNDSALIEIANIYLASADKTYQEILRKYMFQNNSFSILYELNMFFDYLREKGQIERLAKDLYISLVFSSLAGFYSESGKAQYVHSIEYAHDVYRFFNRIYHQFKNISYSAFQSNFFQGDSRQKGSDSQLFESITQFNKSFAQIKEVYLKLIVPSFIKLSWVKHDVNHSDHPEVLFRYGRILHETYGKKNKGLSYILLAKEKNYLPAVKYLGEYYLHQKGFLSDEGEKLMLQFLRESRKNTGEKLSIVHDLFSINMMRGENAMDSIQKGASSLKRSCLAAFSL